MTSLFSTLAVGLSVLLMCSVSGLSEVHADPLTFEGTTFLLAADGTKLDLFTNQGTIIQFRFYDGLQGALTLIFDTLVKYPAGLSVTDTIRFTYREEGAAPQTYTQTFGPSDFTPFTPPLTLGFVAGFLPSNRTGIPTPTTLTVDLLNSSPDFIIPSGLLSGQAVDSYTYSFFTVAPVPEPSTWALLLTAGVGALVFHFRRRIFGRGASTRPQKR